MIDSQLIAMGIIVILYMIVGVRITVGVFNTINRHGEAAFDASKIVSDDNIYFVEEKAGTLSFIVGALWIFFVVFSCWAEIGRRVYEDIIINKDEESRIASWVV